MVRWAQVNPEIECRLDNANKPAFVGYAAVYYRSDQPGSEFKLSHNVVERIAPGAFDRAIAEGQDVRGLINHDPSLILGRTKSRTMTLTANKRGLQYEIPFDEHDPDHVRLKRKIERGDISGSSFGFIPRKDEWSQEGDTEVRTLKDVDLVDVSAVTFPAYTAATSTVRAEDLEEVRAALGVMEDPLQQVLARLDALELKLSIQALF